MGIYTIFPLYVIGQETPIQSSALDRLLEEVKTLGANQKNEQLLTFRNSLESINTQVKTKEDSLTVRQIFMFLGFYIRKNTGLVAEAQKWYLKAHDYVLDKKYLDNRIPFVEQAIGNNYDRLNDHDKSIYFYEKCIPGFRANQQWDRLARLYKDIGNAYGFKGDTLNQLTSYSKVLKWAKKSGDATALCSAYEVFSQYYLHRNEKLFDLNFNQAIGILRKVPNSNLKFQRRAHLYSLNAQRYLLSFRYVEAVGAYLEALASIKENITNALPRDFAKIHINIAEVYMQQKAYRRANQHLDSSLVYLIKGYESREFLPTIGEDSKENSFIDVLYGKALIQQNRYTRSREIKHLDTALMAIDLALQVNDRLDADLSMPESQMTSVGVFRSLTNFGVKSSFRLLKLTSDNGYLYKTQTYIQQSKNRILTRNNRQRFIEASMEDSDRHEAARLRQALFEARLKKQDTSDYTGIIEIQDSLLLLQQKYGFYNISEQPIDAPYLEYCITEDSVYVFTNIYEDQVFCMTSTDSLTSWVKLFHKGISTIDRVLTDKAGRTLYRMLIPEQIELRGDVTIIPDGILANLPFEALNNEGRYLIETATIHYQYKQSQSIAKPLKRDGLRILGVAPNYASAGYPQQAIERGELGVLPGAKKEIQAIKEIMDGRMDLKERVNVRQLVPMLNDYSIFHYAGHAIVRQDSAYLALVDTSNTIFRWTNDMIYRIPENADMVVLSACETGAGSFLHGEGVISLGSSFLQSGASSVIYSLWKSHDQSTLDIMTNFYRKLKDGKSKDQALKLAKLEMLEHGPPDFRHPYYWAGLVAIGDMSPVVKGTSAILKIVTLLLLAALFMLIYFSARKKHTS